TERFIDNCLAEEDGEVEPRIADVEGCFSNVALRTQLDAASRNTFLQHCLPDHEDLVELNRQWCGYLESRPPTDPNANCAALYVFLYPPTPPPPPPPKKKKKNWFKIVAKFVGDALDPRPVINGTLSLYKSLFLCSYGGVGCGGR